MPSVAELKRRQARGEPVEGIHGTVSLGLRSTGIMLGTEDLGEWDLDELRRGQRKDPNGNFSGRPPQVLPKALHDEFCRRLLAEGQQQLLDMLLPALAGLRECLDGALRDSEGDVLLIDGHPVVLEVDPGRLRAIQEVLMRVLGKPEQKVSVSAEVKPYQKVERAVIDRSWGDEAIEATATEEPPPTPPRRPRRPKRA
jgi:hypothetical protein